MQDVSPGNEIQKMTDLSWLRPRLAELCGLKRSDGIVSDFYLDPSGNHFAYGVDVKNYGSNTWRPDEDVAQAVRCLEAMRSDWDIEIFSFEDWVVTLQLKTLDREKQQEADVSLPRAICLAIAAALGWTKEAAERGAR